MEDPTYPTEPALDLLGILPGLVEIGPDLLELALSSLQVAFDHRQICGSSTGKPAGSSSFGTNSCETSAEGFALATDSEGIERRGLLDEALAASQKSRAALIEETNKLAETVEA